MLTNVYTPVLLSNSKFITVQPLVNMLSGALFFGPRMQRKIITSLQLCFHNIYLYQTLIVKITLIASSCVCTELRFEFLIEMLILKHESSQTNVKTLLRILTPNTCYAWARNTPSCARAKDESSSSANSGN